jgi:hypothetical protein
LLHSTTYDLVDERFGVAVVDEQVLQRPAPRKVQLLVGACVIDEGLEHLDRGRVTRSQKVTDRGMSSGPSLPPPRLSDHRSRPRPRTLRCAHAAVAASGQRIHLL